MNTFLKIGSLFLVAQLVSCVPINQKKVTVSDNSQTVDTTPPTNTSISIDSGAASTTSTSVTLTLAATDATEMYVTNTSGCGGGGTWEGFSTSKAWTLGQTNGVASVYVKFRDALLNESSCINDTITQVDEAPTAGTGIVFSSLATTSVTVSWGAGTDTLTATTNLQYKLVKASNSAAIDTVGEADSIVGLDLVMDWTSNTLQASATGLSDSTTYYFAVLVRDAADNKVLYSPQNSTTLDGTSPTIGTAINFSSVGATSLTVSWGAATDNTTAQASLQYKLVKASTSTAIDSIAEVDALSGADVLVDWGTNTLTQNVSGLTVDTTYYFSVVVRDAADNKAIYSVNSATTSDSIAPTIGTGISFSAVTSSSMTVSWGAGTDNVTLQPNLQYKLVRATTSDAINTIAEVEAISGADLLVDWGTNTLSYNASSLSEATTYYFSVVVRDASGNKAIYTVQGQSTSDSTAPVIGSGITYSNIASTSVSVNWGKATDAVTAQSALEYKVVKASSSGAIDTIVEADGVLASDVVIDWTDDIDTVSATGLTSATTYYFAVLVRDLSGNKALYSPKVRFTGKMIYVTHGSNVPFDWTVVQSFRGSEIGGVSGADQKCVTHKPNYSGMDQTSQVKAMLVDGTNRRACSTSLACSDPTENIDWVMTPTTPYYNIFGDLHRSTNTAGVFIFGSTSGVAQIHNSSPRAWTGFGYNGGSGGDWRTDSNNCDGWTGGITGSMGEPYNTNGNMIGGTNNGCSSTFGVLYCVEQ
jgi:hypothetical protein